MVLCNEVNDKKYYKERIKVRVKSLFLLIIGLCFMLLRISYAGEWTAATVGTPGEYSAFHQSMAMDDSGRLHIAYYQGWSHKKIRYATNKSGVWQTNSIDDNGRVTSIALDSKNNVHIIYFAKAEESGLKYATNSSGSWNVTTLDSNPMMNFTTP